MAPCPMCQPNKFREGRIAWFGALKAIAVIGHECANSEINRLAEREFAVRQAVEQAEAYLLDTLPLIVEMRLRRASLQPRIDVAQTAFGHFRKRGAAYQKLLRQATKSSDVLTVAEILKSNSGGPSGTRTAGSTVQTRDVQFGILAGRSAIASQCTLRECSNGIEVALGHFPAVLDDDQILDFISSRSPAEKIELEKTLRGAADQLEQLPSKLDAFAQFFTPANAHRIAEWGGHHDNETPIRAACSRYDDRGAVLFELTGLTNRAALIIPSLLWRPGSGPFP